MLVYATAPSRAADCAAVIGGRLDRFTAQVDGWQHRCARRADVAGCRARVQLRTVGAATRASRAIGRACAGVHLFDPAPAGLAFPRRCAELAAGRAAPACEHLAIADGRSLADCLLCWQRADVETLAAWLLPCTRAASPCGCDAAAEADTRCRRAIAIAAFDEQTRKTRALSACLRDVRSGRRNGPCPDLRTELQSAAALTRMRRTVASCDRPPPAWAACAGTEAATTCRNVTTLTGVTACLDDTTARLATASACRRDPTATGLSCAAPPAH